MKYYNGLYEIREWNDTEHEDYDYYEMGVQIEADGMTEEDAEKCMDEIIEDFCAGMEFGAEYSFCGFCAEYEFDIVGCDVL